MRRLGRIAAVLMLFSAVGCADDRIQGRETARISSPDQVVDAVLVVKETNATVATPLELYVVPRGAPPSNLALVLRGDHFENVSLRWTKPKFLEVQYDTLRIFTFRNFWMSREVSNFSYVVEIRLKPMRESFSLEK